MEMGVILMSLAALIGKPLIYSSSIIGMSSKMATAPAGSGEAEADQNQDRFNEMEHRNWEQGFEAYDQG